MSYTLTNKEYSQLKSKLTRAINSKDPNVIIKTVDEAEAIFNEKGYPDFWNRWEIARQDAIMQKRRSG